MYVRDELGGFSECAYSLLLSYRSSHPSRGGDQQELVTASLRFRVARQGFLGRYKGGCLVAGGVSTVIYSFHNAGGLARS